MLVVHQVQVQFVDSIEVIVLEVLAEDHYLSDFVNNDLRLGMAAVPHWYLQAGELIDHLNFIFPVLCLEDAPDYSGYAVKILFLEPEGLTVLLVDYPLHPIHTPEVPQQERVVDLVLFELGDVL